MIKINAKNFLLILGLFLFVTLKCHALPWDNKPLPRINTKSKIDYVNMKWWENYNDEYLKIYIIKAIENNHDAKRASWMVEQYKQLVKVQFSQELPSLNVGGNYILSHYPENFIGFKNNTFIVPFQATYEADVFLKAHDKTKAIKKGCQASVYQEKSLYITLASAVATTYINLIKFDKDIQIKNGLLAIKQEQLKRENAKYKMGTTSIINLNLSKKDVETAKNNLFEAEKMRDKTLTQFAVLIGESPANIHSLQRCIWDKFNYQGEIPKSISSDVIFSRPDILAAESTLEQAKIDIRVARKEFLPKVTLVGWYALNNIGPGGFGSWETTLAGFLAGVTQDLFRGGLKVANLKAQKAKYEQMFEAYRQADLDALKDVNDSLTIINEDEKVNANTLKNLAFQNDNYSKANNSYKNGVISYLDLLSEEEKLLNQKQNFVNSKTVCLIDYITLYKAVGGDL